MTIQELIPLLIEDGRYFTEGETQVPKVIQARTHKKWRINKKWAKRYGVKIVYEKKMAKVADITLDNVIEFCQEKNIPIPMEFMINKGEKTDD